MGSLIFRHVQLSRHSRPDVHRESERCSRHSFRTPVPNPTSLNKAVEAHASKQSLRPVFRLFTTGLLHASRLTQNQTTMSLFSAIDRGTESMGRLPGSSGGARAEPLEPSPQRLTGNHGLAVHH